MSEENVISKDEKFVLLKKCLPISKSFFETKYKLSDFKNFHYKDVIDSIDYILENNSIRYQDAFFYTLATSPYFLEIKKLVLKKELDFSNLKDPYFWNKEENITINVSIFFSSTFLNELFKEDLENDFKLMSSFDTIDKYLALREVIITKNENS